MSLRCSARRFLIVATALAICGCVSYDEPPVQEPVERVEPDVFDVMRASNSRAAVEYLRQRHQEEREHARLLDEEIARLRSAEEGLTQELEEERQRLRSTRDQIAKTEGERADLLVSLQALQQSKLVVEQQRAQVGKDLEALTREKDHLEQQKSAVQALLDAAKKALEELNAAKMTGPEQAAAREQLRQLLEKLTPPNRTSESPADGKH